MLGLEGQVTNSVFVHVLSSCRSNHMILSSNPLW